MEPTTQTIHFGKPSTGVVFKNTGVDPQQYWNAQVTRKMQNTTLNDKQSPVYSFDSFGNVIKRTK
jgi:hypothetical protein